MFKTCLKHDFRSLKNLGGLMLLIQLSSAFMAGILIRLIGYMASTGNDLFAFLLILLGLGTLLCFFLMIGSMFGTFVVSFSDMAKSFFTDQGYLTFTLPVKRSTLYWSKVLTATVLQALSQLDFIVGILWIALCFPIGTSAGFLNIEIFGLLGKSLELIEIGFGAWPLLWILPALLLLVTTLFFSNGMIYLCVIIAGTRVNKHKIAAGIGIYYLMNGALSFVSTIGMIFLLAAAVDIGQVAVGAGGAILGLTVAAMITIAAMIIGCLAAMFHFTAVGMLERKINLS